MLLQALSFKVNRAWLCLFLCNSFYQSSNPSCRTIGMNSEIAVSKFVFVIFCWSENFRLGTYNTNQIPTNVFVVLWRQIKNILVAPQVCLETIPWTLDEIWMSNGIVIYGWKPSSMNHSFGWISQFSLFLMRLHQT